MTTVNKEYIILAVSGTHTGDYATDTISSAHGIGIQVVVDIQRVTAGSVVATIQGKDPVSSKYYDILSSAAALGAATKILTVYPGIAVVGNTTANFIIPYNWRVNIVSASGTAVYTIGANVLD